MLTASPLPLMTGLEAKRSCIAAARAAIDRAGRAHRAVVFEHDLARLSQHRAYVQASELDPYLTCQLIALMAC